MAEAIIFCAHPDDEIFGAGATIAKYRKENKEVITVICSTGEKSHPWLKQDYLIKMRKEESQRASRIVRTSKNIFFDLKEGKLNEELQNSNIQRTIKELIKKNRPKKIFTHALDDPHPDHKAIGNAIIKITDSINYQGHVYSFEIWNPVNIKKRDIPKLYIDVSKTFHLKIKALKEFKSQIGSLIPLLPVVYIRAFFAGLHAKCKYAEVFYKIK